MEIKSNQKIRVRLESFNRELLNTSIQKISEIIRDTEVYKAGVASLPTDKRIYCVLRSPHVNKDSREHFEMRTHKRLIDVHSPSESTMESLKNLDLSAGVDVEIKSLG